jgi:hypothetical protein
MFSNAFILSVEDEASSEDTEHTEDDSVEVADVIMEVKTA